VAAQIEQLTSDEIARLGKHRFKSSLDTSDWEEAQAILSIIECQCEELRTEMPVERPACSLSPEFLADVEETVRLMLRSIYKADMKPLTYAQAKRVRHGKAAGVV
jgi:hypothetical protein